MCCIHRLCRVHSAEVCVVREFGWTSISGEPRPVGTSGGTKQEEQKRDDNIAKYVDNLYQTKLGSSKFGHGIRSGDT